MENRNNEDWLDDQLSDNPEENLRMENELLRLKLKAELGAEPHNVSEIDPEIENQFLKHILAFEHNFANSKPVKVYDLLGRPDFKTADALNDSEIEDALLQITDLLFEKNMEVYFGDGYDSRTKYHFITAELFEHETDFLPMPGMTTHFDYEEFHPNHQKDIERAAIKFINGWFARDTEECGWQMASHFALPDRKILSKAEVVAQLENIFEAYTAFTDDKYVLKDIGFQLQEESGLGHAEGLVKYNAVLENGGTVALEGPFKLYMTFERGYWGIFHIIFPGFRYF